MTTEPDLIQTLLAMVRAEFPQCTDDQAARLDQQTRDLWRAKHGERAHIAKARERKPGRPAKAPEVMQRAYADALGTEPTLAITKRHGISRSTLYTLLKRGPPADP